LGTSTVGAKRDVWSGHIFLSRRFHHGSKALSLSFGEFIRACTQFSSPLADADGGMLIYWQAQNQRLKVSKAIVRSAKPFFCTSSLKTT
jgi:hypothetical protein